MATGILVGGTAGTGKSTSMETLNPEETVLIKVVNKPLPFRGEKKNYTALTKEGGNLVITDKAPQIISTLNYVNEKRPEIKVVVIDDFQYMSAFEFMRRSKETGFTKFSDIGKNLFDVATLIPNLRDDLTVIMMNHLDVEKDEFGGTTSKIKTVGRLVDQYLVVEGLFTIVLYTDVDPNDKKMPYAFVTRNDGTNTVKTPKGMFDDERIPNDLGFVIQKVKEYAE
jgi:hypothetical protein